MEDRTTTEQPKKERKKRLKISPQRWAELRLAYSQSDKDLIEFSYERTQNPNDPSYSALESKAREERWHLDRELWQLKNNPTYAAAQEALSDEAVKKKAEAIKRLLDSYEAVERHIKLSQVFQSFFLAAIVPKLQGALSHLDLEQLAKRDPRGFTVLIKDWMGILATASEMERKARGMTDLTVDLNLNQDVKLDVTVEQVVKELDELDEMEVIQGYLERIRAKS